MEQKLLQTLGTTIADVLPLTVIIFGFQMLVLRRPIANLVRVGLGFMYVLVGLDCALARY